MGGGDEVEGFIGFPGDVNGEPDAVVAGGVGEFGDVAGQGVKVVDVEW